MTQSINRIHTDQELRTEYDKSVYLYNDGVWSNTKSIFHKLYDYQLFNLHTISNIDTEIANYTQYYINDCVIYNNAHYICKETHILSSEDKSGTALNTKYWYNYESAIANIQTNDYVITFENANNIFKYSEECSNSYWNMLHLASMTKTEQEEEMVFPTSSPTKIGILSTDTATAEHYVGQYFNACMKKKYEFSCYVKTISSYRVRYVALMFYSSSFQEYYSVVFDLNTSSILRTETLDANYNVKSSPSGAFTITGITPTKLSATEYRIGMYGLSNYDCYVQAQFNILSDDTTPKYKFAQTSGSYTCYINAFQLSEYNESKTISALPFYITTKSKTLHYWVQDKIYQKTETSYTALTCNLYYFDKTPTAIVANGDLGIVSSLVSLDCGAIFGKNDSTNSADNRIVYYDQTNNYYVLKDREGVYKQIVCTEDTVSNQKIMMLDAMTYHQGQYETYFPSHTFYHNTNLKFMYGIDTGGCYNWKQTR